MSGRWVPECPAAPAWPAPPPGSARSAPPARHRGAVPTRASRTTQARDQGKSIRSIAEQEGVSKSQVERDLADSASCPPPGTTGNTSPGGSQNGSNSASCPGGGTTGNTSPSGSVIGRSGKPYPKARKPKKQAVLCSRCQRVGAAKGCPQCQELRKAAKPRKAKAMPKPPPPPGSTWPLAVPVR